MPVHGKYSTHQFPGALPGTPGTKAYCITGTRYQVVRTHLSFAVLVLIPGRRYLLVRFCCFFLPYPLSTIACIASSKCSSAASFWCVKAAEDDVFMLIIYKKAIVIRDTMNHMEARVIEHSYAAWKGMRSSNGKFRGSKAVGFVLHLIS